MGKVTNIRAGFFFLKILQGKEINCILMHILTSTRGDQIAPLFHILIKNTMAF